MALSLPGDRIITHYENYFRDANAELHRVLDFLEIPVSAELIDRSTSAISTELRHHGFDGDLSDEAVDRDVFNLYRHLCREADFIEPAGIQH